MEPNKRIKHIEDNNIQNEGNPQVVEDNPPQVVENNPQVVQKNPCALENPTMHDEQHLEAMMEIIEPIQDVNANPPNRRMTRGPTKMKRLPSNFTNRVEIEFNENAEPIGEG